MGSRSTQKTTMPITVSKGPGPGGVPGQLRRVAGVLGVTALVLLAPPSAGAQSTSPNVADLNKQLFAAVRAGQETRVRALLTAGADPMATNAFGLTPAGLAIDRSSG